MTYTFSAFTADTTFTKSFKTIGNPLVDGNSDVDLSIDEGSETKIGVSLGKDQIWRRDLTPEGLFHRKYVRKIYLLILLAF